MQSGLLLIIQTSHGRRRLFLAISYAIHVLCSIFCLRSTCAVADLGMMNYTCKPLLVSLSKMFTFHTMRAFFMHLFLSFVLQRRVTTPSDFHERQKHIVL